MVQKYTVILILAITLIYLVDQGKCQDSSPEKNVCTTVMDMVNSATKCISQSSDEKSKLNLNSPKDALALLTDSNRRACVAKCVMQDRNLITAEGKLNPNGFLAEQTSLPEEMRKKLTIETLQPCIDISANFDPVNCTSYGEFSRCALGVIVKAFDPTALDCFTKIPAVGPLFALIQSYLSNNSTIHGSASGFFKQIRSRISTGAGNMHEKIDGFLKEIGSKHNQPNSIKLNRK